ncbi:hypothetical protein B0O99DRAFT_541572 [Bisporella sp. PMI_857]|nr:hypothetical protein B0O99DRAFT_541572 [Bisporella sp. PMI_857]
MWTSLRGNQITLQDQWRATSYYSPIFDRFDIPKISRVTNGTLFDTNPPSIWRARIGDKVDAAWDRVGSIVPPIVITADEVRAIGKNPDTAVKFPDEYGYGPDAYMASVEVFHHLHCLDKLRKEISYAHYWEKEEGPAPGGAMHEAHTSHCIDVLAQALRCTGSVDMITYNWVEGRSMMLPDFENNKVCRDFDAILDWTNKNGVLMDESRLRAMSPPPGALRVPNPLRISHEK